MYWELTTNLPPIDKLAQYRPPVATEIFADDGTVIGEFYLEKRYLLPIERIPPRVRNAFIAAEDDTFYEHGGVDPISIVRAFVNNVAAGGKVQGGSTITQQVVKSLLLSPKKSYERKLKEVILAMRLERQFSKDEILYLYLNHIYLGASAYGVAAAAQEYFGKRVDELSVAEAALLAGLPQAPSRYSPFRHWRRARARQHYVIDRMVAAQFITPADADAARREPIALASRSGSYKTAPYYVEHVRRLLEERYGETAAYAIGLRVHTALNLDMQRAAEVAVRDGLAELAAREHYGAAIRHLDPPEVEAFLRAQRAAMSGAAAEHGRVYEAVVVGDLPAVKGRPPQPPGVRVKIGASAGVVRLDAATQAQHKPLRAGDVVQVRLADIPATAAGPEFVQATESVVQGALLAIDPHTGDVKAMVGGTDFDTSQFNRAVQSARQPGSSFKPLVYAAALDRDFTPASVIVDGPVSFRSGNGYWTPQNYENRYFGPTTLRNALTFSRNVVTVKLANQIGVKPLIKYVRRFGITSPMEPNLSLALGSAEVTLSELASAYTAFANGGQRAEPRFITRVTDGQGALIDDATPRVTAAISPETAYIVTSMLHSVIERGTGQRAKELGRPAAGKTGTTNDLNDAWFVGYTPQLLTGVWVGFDEKRALGSKETGGRVAAPIWTQFMTRALENEPVLDFPVPEGIAFAWVNSYTGRRVTPGSGGAILECFRRGSEPAPPVIQAASTAPEPAPSQDAVPDVD